MKQKRVYLLLALLLTLTLSACGTNGLYQVILVTDGNHTLTSPAAGELIVMGGDVTVPENVSLDGSAHLVSGTLYLDGTILGDVSALGGMLIFGDNAAIEGILNHGGGTLEGNAVEDVAAKINTGTGIQIPELAPTEHQKTGELVTRWLISAALTGLLALGLNKYLPNHLMLVGETMVQHVWVAIAMGMLVGIVGLTLTVLMAYTIILVPIAILGFLVLGFAMIFGWISFAIFLGRAISAQYATTKPKLFIFSSVFLVILGTYIVDIIPVIGSIADILFGVIGLGAVFLTRFGLRRFVPETIFAQT